MTDSSQQQFFLDQFQKVRDLLDGGDARSALGVMLDIREAGFVNKELDTMIEALRDEPPAEVVREAQSWADLIIERLTSYGGDVFQLVEDLSEASLGLSEAEWVPVIDDNLEDVADDELLSLDVGDFDDAAFDMELEDVDDAAFDSGPGLRRRRLRPTLGGLRCVGRVVRLRGGRPGLR